MGICGAVPEWLGIGLQNRIHQFDSGRHLQNLYVLSLNIMKRATAYANANIALVKYWGKNDSPHNIPAVSSISMTLHDVGTEVALAASTLHHELLIENQPAPSKASARVSAYLEQVRMTYPFSGFMRINSHSTVPYEAGLASSASFFAALAKAIDHSLGLNLSLRDQSILARRGSGSAARSIFPGFSGLYGGLNCAHEDAYGFPLEIHPDLDLCMVLAVVDDQKKPISSRDAMNISKRTSPFFGAFVGSHEQDFLGAIEALKDGSFATLGAIMEHSTLKMFSTMWSATPAINYWQPKSLALINLVYGLREKHGPIAFFTMDAGPNVKILCQERDLPIVVKAIAEANLTLNIACVASGCGARLKDIGP